MESFPRNSGGLCRRVADTKAPADGLSIPLSDAASHFGTTTVHRFASATDRQGGVDAHRRTDVYEKKQFEVAMEVPYKCTLTWPKVLRRCAACWSRDFET